MKPTTIQMATRFALCNQRPLMLVCATAFGLLSTLLPVRSCSAQAILITEPVEWRDGKAVTVALGQSVRVAGSASHPNGLLKVLVNGQEALLQADAAFPDLFRFEKVIIADTAREVTIAIVLRSGQEWERTYSVNPSATAQPQRTNATASFGNAQRDSVRSGQPSAWQGFQARSVGYGMTAAVGLALAAYKKTERVCVATTGQGCTWHTQHRAAYRSVGLGLAGAAVAALAIDALITSGKAKSQNAAQRSGSNHNRLDWEALQFTPSVHGPRFDLLTIRLWQPAPRP